MSVTSVSGPVRVAIVVRGDLERAASRSGVPHGLATGLRALGIDVLHVPADLPRTTDRLAGRALAEPERARLRGLALRLRMRALGGVAGVVQLGSEFSVSAAVPVVTFEDMTLCQHVALGDAWVASRSPRTLAAWFERQRRAYEQAVGCCVASRWAAESVVRDYGIAPGKVRVVGRGHTHAPSPVSRDWSVPRFLFVGKDWRRKNLTGVLDAFARLRREIPSAQLDVVSPCPPTDQDGVVLHGALRLDAPAERRRVEELFESATCFVMPSRHEAFGIVYTEASAAGIASIGTAVGAAREIIGDAGRIVDPDDPGQLLVAMRELADPDTAQRLGTRAAQRSVLFTWRAVGERVARALDLQVDDSLGPLAEFL